MSEELQSWKQRIEELMGKFIAGGDDADEAYSEMSWMAWLVNYNQPSPKRPFIDFVFPLDAAVSFAGKADICGNIISCSLRSESEQLDVTSETFADFCDIALGRMMDELWEDVSPEDCAEFAKMWWELKQELEQLKASQC